MEQGKKQEPREVEGYAYRLYTDPLKGSVLAFLKELFFSGELQLHLGQPEKIHVPDGFSLDVVVIRIQRLTEEAVRARFEKLKHGK